MAANKPTFANSAEKKETPAAKMGPAGGHPQAGGSWAASDGGQTTISFKTYNVFDFTGAGEGGDREKKGQDRGDAFVNLTRAAIELAKDTGAPVHICHLQASAMQNIAEFLRLIREAREQGHAEHGRREP